MLVYLRCKELLKDSCLRAKLCSLGQQPEQFCMLVCREQNRGFNEYSAEAISRRSLSGIIMSVICWRDSNHELLLRAMFSQMSEYNF